MPQSARPRHPVVSAYVSSDVSLMKILQDAPEPRGPMVEAMLAMREALGGARPIQDALGIARAVPQQGADPDLAILFLGMWATLVLKLPGGQEEAAVLVRRARSLLGRNTPPQIRTIPLYQESLQLLGRGDCRGAEQALLESMRGLETGAPRHRSVLLNLGFFLAEQGRGQELEPRIEDALRAAPGQYASRAALMRYANRVATGRLEELDPLRAEFDADDQLRTINSGLIAMYDGWLNLMRGGAPAFGEPTGAAVIRELLARRSEGALELARRQTRETPELPSTGVGLFAFDLVRAELAAGRGEAALRIIEMRRVRGNGHYLDELFLARAEMLAGDRRAAARHFAEVVRSCRRYRAEGRLDFELRLACELSPGDLMWLARTSQEESGPLPASGRAPEPEPEPDPDGPPRGAARLLGRSRAIESVREQILKLAAADASVLITGETGTGKELVARALHESGPRAARPFVAVNCGAITESLLESELFGHVRGAFTGAERAHRGIFEEAGDGTVLLDEIGDLSPRLQAALLRVLETGEVRPVGSAASRKVACRILAATNAHLGAQAEAGRFRKDLLYRLRRLEIFIPPLRERREDLLCLADAFLCEGRRDGRRPELREELRGRLLAHDWPGNVRELRNEIERMRLTHSDKLEYGPEDLGARIGQVARQDAGPAFGPAGGEPSGPPKPPELPDARSTLRRRDRIREIFLRYRRLNGSELSRALGVSPKTICRDLAELVAEGFVEKVMPTASPRTHYFALKAPPEPGTAGTV